MIVMVTDAAGNILRTCTVLDEPTALLQIGADGSAVYRAPDGAAFIDDRYLIVADGVLTLKPDAPADTLYGGAPVVAIDADS